MLANAEASSHLRVQDVATMEVPVRIFLAIPNIRLGRALVPHCVSNPMTSSQLCVQNAT